MTTTENKIKDLHATIDKALRDGNIERSTAEFITLQINGISGDMQSKQAGTVTLDAERLPTVQEFLDSLDGYGLTITDEDLITERLASMGKAPLTL